MRHGENGLLFDHNSVDDLTAQLAKLADDAVVARLGAEAYRSYWSNPLTLEIHTSRLVAFYRSLIGAGRQGGGPVAPVHIPGVPA